MKKLLLIITIIFSLTRVYAQNGVAISTSSSATPDATAILDVQSTTQGVLMPRMTEVQRDAISSPVTGLMIYQTDNTPGFYHYDGANWVANGSTAVIAIDDLTDGKYIKESYYLGLNSGVSASQLYSEKNVGIGEGSLQNVDWGAGCVAVGYNSLNTMANSYYNTALGAYAGSDVTGNSNTFIGYQAGVVATSAVSNIAIGSEALNTLSTGDNNIAVTYGAANITSGSSNIVIGPASTNIADGTADNQMNIGSTIYATGMTTASVKVGIGNGNNAPAATLDVDGDVSIGTVLHLTPLATAPSSPSAGDIYYSSGTNIAYCYDGSVWQALW
ncbi:MAG: hypothetical protein DRI84_05920 [Bacteroidetes bacterium]|nr:MAG: hypothetical protein DRI84_05920 [Bacteroidota bacterium]